MPTPSKRRVFTDREDVLLLTQISAESPHLARRGTIMDVWESVARNVASLAEFDRPLFDGKKAQGRFHILMKEHRSKSAASERASGASEEVTEKVVLLDNLRSQVDDKEEADAINVSALAEEAERVEESAAYIRD